MQDNLKQRIKSFLEFIYQKQIFEQEYFNDSYSFFKNDFKIAEIYCSFSKETIFEKNDFLYRMKINL